MQAYGCAVYEFGTFRLDPAERLLSDGGQSVALSPKVFDLLVTLVRNAGRMVEKEELMREVWPDTFVEENNLTVNISALRKALGKSVSEQEYIQTVPRRGYRFAVTVRQTGSLKGPVASAEAGSEFLVGREPELRALEGFLRRAIDGGGRMVFVTGEPGIGKTALSQAFVGRVRSQFPLVALSEGRCLEHYGAGEAYLPFLDSLSQLLSGPNGKLVAAVLRSHAPTWCLQFPAFFGSDESVYRETVGATKERMLREMVDALGALTSDTPLVLHLEDVHWADPSSIDLLRRLCPEVERLRLLVTGTIRPEDAERNPALKSFLLEMQSHRQCEEMALGLLSEEHLSTYLDARFTPNRFQPELAALIYRKTEGQPLFATGLIQFLAERGGIAQEAGHWILKSLLSELDLETPANVRKMIQKKVEALETEDRRALEYASIQGEEFTSAILANLLETDELVLEERLYRLDKVHRLIQTIGDDELPDGTPATRYRFAHVLFQNSLYKELVNQRRVRLHRRTGELMVRYCGDQAPRFATQLAMHFELGRDFGGAVRFLVHAGDNNSQISAYSQACEHYSRALELSQKLAPDERARVQPNLYKKRGDANLSRGLPQSAERDYNSLLAMARGSGDFEWECRALIDLANVHIYTRKPEEMAACASQALKVAERIQDQASSCEAKGQLAASYQVVGRVEEAHRLYDESIAAARSLQHTSALLQGLTYRGVAHFFRSEYDQAVSTEAEAVELASRTRNGFYLALSRTYLGYSLGNQGRISEALDCLNEACALGRRNENRIVLARAPNGIGWIQREIGNLKQAVACNEASLQAAREAGATEAEANALINLVYDYTLAGEFTKAAETLERVDSLYDCELWNRWRFYEVRQQAASAEYWLAARNLDRAEEHARALLANAQRYGVPKYVAIAHRTLGEVLAQAGDGNRSHDHLLNSLQTLEHSPAPLVEWRSYAALGRLLQQRHRPAASRDAFQRAAAAIRKIAGSITDSHARTTFLSTAEVREILSGHDS